MADKELKVEENTPGRWYVDENCIACDSCCAIAPDNFKMMDDGSYAFVFKQPENEEEEQACIDAQAACPVEAIGDDGDEANAADTDEEPVDAGGAS
ncbi:MAG: ferredoxin [Acidobacteriota bacterium]|jgi:ferredoxin